MSQAIRWLLLFSLLTTPAAFAAPPARVQADYEVTMDGLEVASIRETFNRSQGDYHIESISRAAGLLAVFKPETIRLSSHGELTAHGLRPRQFDQQRERQPQKNNHADFDWTLAKLTLNDALGARSVDLPTGSQDRLSAMYQFLFLSLKPGDTLDFFLTNGSKLTDYHYRAVAIETLSLPAGEFRTLRVSTPPGQGGGDTDIWLSTEHGMLPVKMVITESNGTRYTQTLTRFSLTP
jgi:hypothetical protein